MTKRKCLTDWIEVMGGPTVVGVACEVSESAVRVWMRGEGSPSAKAIAKLIELSKDGLTFEVIYRDSTANKKAV